MATIVTRGKSSAVVVVFDFGHDSVKLLAHGAMVYHCGFLAGSDRKPPIHQLSLIHFRLLETISNSQLISFMT